MSTTDSQLDEPQLPGLCTEVPGDFLPTKINAAIEFLHENFIGYSRNEFKAAILHQLWGGNLLLIGKHGRGKSTLARAIAEMGDQSFVAYDASKADTNVIAGFMDPRRATDGEAIPFIRHAQTVWDKQVIFIDELNRAPYYNQNALLEMMQEKTLYGYPLDELHLLIAAANSGAGYHATMSMDDALFDRFGCILYTRENDLNPRDLCLLFEKPLHTICRPIPFDQSDRRLFRSRVKAHRIMTGTDLAEPLANFIVRLQKTINFTFSERTLLKFQESLFAYVSLETLTSQDINDCVHKAFENAVTFCLLNKARAVRSDTPNVNPNARDVEHLINHYSEEIAQLMVVLGAKLQDPTRQVDLMLDGPVSGRLRIYESHYESIMNHAVAKRNVRVALEQLLHKATVSELTRIVQRDIYPEDIQLAAEQRRAILLFDQELYTAKQHAKTSLFDPARKPNRTRNEAQCEVVSELVREFVPIPQLAQVDKLAEHFDHCRQLAVSQPLSEVMQQGLLLVEYYKPLKIEGATFLKKPSAWTLKNLAPYLNTVAEGVNCRIMAVTRFRNGYRKAENFAHVGTTAEIAGRFYLAPWFLMPKLFQFSADTKLPNESRTPMASYFASILTQQLQIPSLQQPNPDSQNPATTTNSSATDPNSPHNPTTSKRPTRTRRTPK